MAERPSGTVTFLFTDIEGSTRRWEADAEAMRVGLAAHDEVLRSAVEGRGGWLFKHTGDGVCAAFASAPDAVAAAVDAQRRLGLPVRMGVVTGAAEVRGDDYFGPVLNRAARVMAAAHGGQIVLSAVTAGLAEGPIWWIWGCIGSGTSPGWNIFSRSAPTACGPSSRRCARSTRCRGTCPSRPPASWAVTSR